MNIHLDMLGSLIPQELRVQFRNPVWAIGLGVALLLAFSEAYPVGISRMPTINEAFRVYNLGCSLILGVTAFMLTAGSLARDLGEDRIDLILCRPINLTVYLVGKYIANVLFSLGIVLVFMMIMLGLPLFHGQPRPYSLAPFALVTVIASVPSVFYSCALAVLLMSMSRSLIIAFPVYLVYFLSVVMFRIQNVLLDSPPDVDFLDFSMRLYPHSLSHYIGMGRLSDISYSYLLNPPRPELFTRAAGYSVLSLVIVIVSAFFFNRMRGR